MGYQYEHGKNRIINALQSKTQIMKKDIIPSSESKFTYENGIKSWVGAIFVDIVDSTNLFKNEKEEIVARVMRAFCKELIIILKENYNYRKIGIRGDCVYAIYTVSIEKDLKDILKLAICINTFQKMFQMILKQNNFPTFNIGIGLGAAEELIIKAGQPYSGINNFIWIGDAVVNAAKLSSEANRNGHHPIMLDQTFYNHIKNFYVSDNEKYASYFSKVKSIKLGEDVYSCNMTKDKFNYWINNGMKWGD